MEENHQEPVAAEESEETKDLKAPREGRDGKPAKKNYKKQAFKKFCLFCQEKSTIDYKDVNKTQTLYRRGRKDSSPPYDGHLCKASKRAFDCDQTRESRFFDSFQSRLTQSRNVKDLAKTQGLFLFRSEKRKNLLRRNA